MTVRGKATPYLLGLEIPTLALAFFLFASGVVRRETLSTLFTAKALYAEESEAVKVCSRIHEALPWLMAVAGGQISPAPPRERSGSSWR